MDNSIQKFNFENIRPIVSKYLFLNRVFLLMSGTVIGQIIVAVSLPILTRLYSPASFGLLGTFTMITMVLATPACLRFELALPLPESDEDAICLFALAFALAAISSAFIGSIVLIFSDEILRLLGQPGLKPFLWYVPVGVWLLASYSALQFWSIRMKRLRDVASTQVTRALGSSATQIGMSFFDKSALGLMIGQLVYYGMGIRLLGARLWQIEKSELSAISLQRMLHIGRKYVHFVTFNTPESLLNACIAYVPILLIGAYSGSAEAGHALVAFRVTSIPISLIGGNLSRVFLSEGAERERAGTLNAFTRKIMRNLMLASLPFFVILAFISPLIFPYLFGAAWHRSGEMVAWMVPFVFLQFICSPVSTILLIKNSLKTSFLLQAAGFVIVIGAMLAVGFARPGWVFEAFAIASIIYYGAYLSVILRMTRKYLKIETNQ